MVSGLLLSILLTSIYVMYVLKTSPLLYSIGEVVSPYIVISVYSFNSFKNDRCSAGYSMKNPAWTLSSDGFI